MWFGKILSVALLGPALVAACGQRRDGEAAPAAVTSAAKEKLEAPLAGEQVEIPSGAFLAGTTPGKWKRDPALEPRESKLTLGAFRIDRLPFPNDPAQPPLVNVSRAEAAERCAGSGKRLCTELEWERACKGPASSPFSTGDNWDLACEKTPSGCRSGFNVLAMGSISEWTSSSFHAVTEEGPAGTAIARGAPAGAEADLHRCAHRSALAESDRSATTGFRCCKGAPNAAIVSEAQVTEAFLRIELPLTKLATLLEAAAETKDLARELVYFSDDAADTVLARGTGERQGFQFTTAPLRWSPALGAEFLVVVARSGKDTSFVVAFWVTGENEYQLAASMIMEREAGPIALAFSNDIRPRLHFSSCWGCLGETGKILYRKPDAVAILQP